MQPKMMCNFYNERSLMMMRVLSFLTCSALIMSSDAFVLTKRYGSWERIVPTGIHHNSVLLLYGCDSLLLQQPSHRPSNTKQPTSILERRTFGDADDATSKGIVSLMTDVVNSVFDAWFMLYPRTATLQGVDAGATSFSNSNASGAAILQQQPPSSPLELLERIRNDYTERNYLWTGDLDVETNFVKSCCFTDPTLSFVGTDKYIKNIQNLRPILNLITDVEKECRSELMDIQLYDTYIQTRWNMIGTLSRLPWQPRIDVIGKTKFWFHNDTNRIYFYDEIWEIPASQALLQLITPKNYDS